MLANDLAFEKRGTTCPCGQSSDAFHKLVGHSEGGKCWSTKCGQKFIPPARQNYRTSAYYPPLPQQQPPVLPVIANDEVLPSIFGIPKSPFCQLCKRITGIDPAIFYWLGAYRNDVVFWYRDFERVVRNKKNIRYQANGFNRRKDVKPEFKEGYYTPFWGEEHLQEFNALGLTDIFIVESEKTAIYGQFSFSWALWLGSNGAWGCTVSKIDRIKHLLTGKRLFVLFDNDKGGQDGTASAIKNFKQCGVRADALLTSDIVPNAPAGCDLADAILAAKGVTL
jgi:hypothetical protein